LTVPDYWLPRPPLEADEPTDEAVDAFLAGDLDLNGLPRGVMPWQFLCALAARRQIAFHGTGDPGIERFEPREPVDFAPFGQQRAVFATSDPIWAMFYAIVDRTGHELTLNNGCLVLDDLGESYYYFSVSRQALDRQPWRTGYSRARSRSSRSRACASSRATSRSSTGSAVTTTIVWPSTPRR